MRVMDVLTRIKNGERVMVHLSPHSQKDQYSLTDGTEVHPDQFATIKHFLKPDDAGLFDGAPPQTFVWGG